MNIEEIKKNAPNRATHYAISLLDDSNVVVYIKYRLNHCCYFLDCKWRASPAIKGESMFELMHDIKPL